MAHVANNIVTAYNEHVWTSDGAVTNYKPSGPALCGYVQQKTPIFIWRLTAEKAREERTLCAKCRQKIS